MWQGLLHVKYRPCFAARGFNFLHVAHQGASPEQFMNSHVISHPSWSTTSFGGPTDTSPMELSALGEHFNHCQCSRGRLFALRCAADAVHGFVVTRFVTTLVVVVGLFAVAACVVL